MNEEQRQKLILKTHSQLVSFDWDKMYLVDPQLSEIWPDKNDFYESLKKTAAWIVDSLELLDDTEELPVTESTSLSVTMCHKGNVRVSLSYYDTRAFTLEYEDKT